jgi:hypothetical protein
MCTPCIVSRLYVGKYQAGALAAEDGFTGRILKDSSLAFPVSGPVAGSFRPPSTRGRETGDTGRLNACRISTPSTIDRIWIIPGIVFATRACSLPHGSQAPRSSKGKASAYLTANSLARREVAVVPPEGVRPYDPTDVTMARSWRHRQSVRMDSKTNSLSQLIVATLALASCEASETALDSLKDDRTRLGVR